MFSIQKYINSELEIQNKNTKVTEILLHKVWPYLKIIFYLQNMTAQFILDNISCKMSEERKQMSRAEI